MEIEKQTMEPNFAGEKMTTPAGRPGQEGDSFIFKNNGAIIVILFIVLGAILAGIFYWYNLSKDQVITPPTTLRPSYEVNKEPESTTAKAQVDTLGVMSSSDELNAIEADLESTSLDSLDSELIQIDQELNASTQ